MKKFYFVAALAILATLYGCTKAEEESCAVVAKSELSIGLPIGISRTAMNDEGEASWVEGDTFLLWAENATGGFNMNGAEFQMMYYWHSTQSAVFTSTTNKLVEGDYTYYAVSPKPESVSNRIVTYTLPVEQQGNTVNGAYDFMVATPTTTAALSTEKINDLSLDFSHKTHLLKLVIPKNGNPLADPVSRVVFTFPNVITGKISIDATKIDANPTINSGSKQLIVNIPEGFEEGEIAWARILPANISGNVSYYAVSTKGERTFERTFRMSKECLAGHITPLSLTIPEPIPPTVLRFSVGKNNLGEAVQKITILDYNRSVLKTFTPNSENIYDIEQYGLYEDGIFSSYAGKTFIMQFESQHAIVEQRINIPSEIAKYEVNALPTVDVPYLLFEDFTSIQKNFDWDDERVDSSMEAKGYLLDDHMSVKGWNAARVKGVSGQSVRINARCQSTVGYTHANGRLDTPNISCLKPGANVKVKLMFDSGCYINSDYGTDNGVTFFMVGTHTQPISNALNGADETTALVWEVIDDKSNISKLYDSVAFTSGYLNGTYGGNSFGDTFPTHTVSIDNCTNSTRISWSVGTTKKSSEAKNAHYYIYIDNIKVSIAQ